MPERPGLTAPMPSVWRMVRFLWPQIRHHLGLLTLGLAGLLFEVVLRLLEPWPIKFVLDYATGGKSREGGVHIPALDALEPASVLVLAAAVLVVLTGLRALAGYGESVAFGLLGNRVLSDVRVAVFDQLQRLSLSFHSSQKSGDLVVRLIHDVDMLRDIAETAIAPLIAGVLVFVGMIGVMAWMNWRLALLSLVVLPFFWLSSARLGKQIRTAAREQRKREGAIAAKAIESIGAIKVVQALGLEGTFAELFVAQNQKSLGQGVTGSRLTARLSRTVDILVAASTALVFWYGGTLVLRGDLTAGDLVVFLSYLRQAFRPVRDLTKLSGRLAKASAGGERVMDLLGRTPEVRDLPGAIPAPLLAGGVRFEGIRFAYEPGHPVLQAITLEAIPGQRIALVGHSGSGKSTLTALLLRLYDPEHGRVLLDGHDIREYTLESLRRQMSIVLQDSVLFATTIRENIRYGLRGASDEQVEAAARLANAHDFILAMPRGYDTVVGERGHSLSGGQRQRIAIARAALRQAPILILDEPTTGLDRKNAYAVIEALEQLARGRTAFLVTHDLDLASRADVIVYLEGGRIVERGTHAELMAAGGRYEALMRMQMLARDRQETEPTGYVLAS